MAISLGNKGYKSDINITPYIDILLVLLIIFMVVNPMKPFDQEVRVPKQSVTPPPPSVKQDQIVVEIDLNHDIHINQMPVSFDKLSTTLYAIFSGRSNKNMYIRGDPKLEYGYVFQILDIAKRSGVGDIALLNKVTADSSGTPSSGELTEPSRHR